jgi:hypothetical protein
MNLDWQEVVRWARGRIVHLDMAQVAGAGLGVAFAIGAMEWSSLAVQYPLVFIPFATSIVLVIGSPEAEPAQPRALIGGHIVATLVGFAVLRVMGLRHGPQRPRSDFPCSPCMSQIRSILRPESIHFWWSPGVFPGLSWSLPCLQARCRLQRSPISGTAGFFAGHGRIVGYDALPLLSWSLPKSCSANRSPSRMSTTFRSWKASSVLRWPIETTVVAGNFSARRR